MSVQQPRLAASDEAADTLTELRRRIEVTERQLSQQLSVAPYRRNLTINGAMAVCQRNFLNSPSQVPATILSQAAVGATISLADTWVIDQNVAGMTAVEYWTAEATGLLPGGFISQSILQNGSNVKPTLASGDYSTWLTHFEASTLAPLRFGQVNASPIAVSMSMLATYAQRVIVELEVINGGSIYSCSRPIDVIGDGVMRRYNVSFPACLGATNARNDNSSGMQMRVWFGGGSTYNSGNPADLNTTWGLESSLPLGVRAAGCGNWWTTPNRDLRLTGVQVEAGQVASAYEFVPYEDDLRSVMRYVQYHDSPPLTGVSSSAANGSRMHMALPVPMRAVPTLTMVGQLPVYDGSTTSTIASLLSAYSTPNMVEVDTAFAAAFTAATRPIVVYNDQSAANYLIVSAQL